MEILNFSKKYHSIGPVWLSIGNFDGVHLGHQALIDYLVNHAKSKQSKSLIITFNPHPKMVLNQIQKNLLMTHHQKKMELIQQLGVDFYWVIPFTQEFSNLSAVQFLDLLTDTFCIQGIVFGQDHMFGKNREGKFELMESLKSKYPFESIQFPKKFINNIEISSTNMRRFLNESKFELYKCMSGRYPSVYGKIVRGQQFGKRLGFPTANLDVEAQILPQNGVYAVRVKIPNSLVFNGMANIGVRPSIQSQRIDNPLLEVHIIDYNEDIYDRYIEVEFIQRIRDEIKFNNKNSLISQLEKDKQKIMEIFS